MVDKIQAPDGRKVAYAQWGDLGGPPVFFLHGTPGCRLDRPERTVALREAGVRVITYDRPAYGASDRHRDRCVADCIEDVRLIADALGLDRFAVVGASGVVPMRWPSPQVFLIGSPGPNATSASLPTLPTALIGGQAWTPRT